MLTDVIPTCRPYPPGREGCLVALRQRSTFQANDVRRRVGWLRDIAGSSLLITPAGSVRSPPPRTRIYHTVQLNLLLALTALVEGKRGSNGRKGARGQRMRVRWGQSTLPWGSLAARGAIAADALILI